MVNHKNIASRLEAAGFSNFSIDYECGVALVFFRSLPETDTPEAVHAVTERVAEMQSITAQSQSATQVATAAEHVLNRCTRGKPVAGIQTSLREYRTWRKKQNGSEKDSRSFYLCERR